VALPTSRVDWQRAGRVGFFEYSDRARDYVRLRITGIRLFASEGPRGQPPRVIGSALRFKSFQVGSLLHARQVLEALQRKAGVLEPQPRGFDGPITLFRESSRSEQHSR
jgi:hypothetical protein